MTSPADPDALAVFLSENGVRGFSMDDADRVLGVLADLPSGGREAAEIANSAARIRGLLARARATTTWQENEKQARLASPSSCAWC